MGFGFWGLGFRVYVFLGFRVLRLFGFRALGHRVQGLGLRLGGGGGSKLQGAGGAGGVSLLTPFRLLTGLMGPAFLTPDLLIPKP